MKNDIFISYSRKDSETVNKFVERFEKEGLRVWIDRDGIESGDAFKHVIVEAIMESSIFLFFSSSASNSSEYTAKEVGFAIKKKKTIIPIKLDSSEYNDEVMFDLVNIDYVDYVDVPKRDVLLGQLVHAIKGKLHELESNLKKPVDSSEVVGEKDSDVTQDRDVMGFSDLVFTVNGVTFAMKYVKGGTFWMGAHNKTIRTGLFSKKPDLTIPNYDNDANENESPVHKVTLSNYYIGETVVTQALWEEIMGGNPSYKLGKTFPVETVSWKECEEFILKLNELSKGQYTEVSENGFRLPTEAEWEFAARGGREVNKYKYSGSDSIDDVAWFQGNSEMLPHPVGEKLPNPLGLYDMTGNVWEWCQDVYSTYPVEPQENPIAIKSLLRTVSKNLISIQSRFKELVNKEAVIRGGSFEDKNNDCRITARRKYETNKRGNNIGFRLVLVPKLE